MATLQGRGEDHQNRGSVHLIHSVHKKVTADLLRQRRVMAMSRTFSPELFNKRILNKANHDTAFPFLFVFHKRHDLPGLDR